MSILADSIGEKAASGATIGTVTRPSDDTEWPLFVSLTTSAPNAADVPGVVVIPAGKASADFVVEASSGNSSPSDQVVTITASATFGSGFGKDSTFKSSTVPFIANAVTTQADGKIIAAGSLYTQTGSFAVQRFNADGTPDATFHNGSAVVVGKVGRNMAAYAVAVQPDGKILVGGNYQDQGTATWNMQLARLTADGQLDASFGAGGWVTLVPTSGAYNEIWDLDVLPDGKILIGGSISYPDTNNDLAVVRLNASGSLDSTFGGGGYAATSFSNGSDRGYGLAVQPDGKILLAGGSYGGNAPATFAVARWTASGQLDATFGAGGKVATDVPGDYDEARGVAVQPDGKIVVAGYSGNSAILTALVRYTSSGALDASFGSGGIVTKSAGAASSVIVRGDGSIVVGSSSSLMRFNADGSALDSIYSNPVGAIAPQIGDRIVVVSYGSSASFLDAYKGSMIVTASDVVTVTGVSAPTAVDDSFEVRKATPLIVAARGVLGNDVSPTGEPLTAVLVSGPRHGSVGLASDGSFVYTPAGAYLGPDGFTYKVTNRFATSKVATVSLDVVGSNDAPAAVADDYMLGVSGQAPQFQLPRPGVLANDADPNGQPITAALASEPASGKLVFNPDGSFVYTPNAGFFGVDRFTYRASDGELSSPPASVTITVYSLPTATAESYTISKGTQLILAVPGVLANDVSPSGAALRAVLVTAPKNGSFSLNGDGSIRYIPPSGFTGQDSFSYYVTDGSRSSPVITDTINVVFINSPPTAGDDAYSYRPDTTLVVGAPGVLFNDRDPDGQPISATVVSWPAHGSLAFNPDGSFTYIPAAGWSGTDGFTYKVGDGELESALVTVRLIVTGPTVDLWSQRGGNEGHSNYVDVAVDAAGISTAWNQPLTYVASGYWAHSNNLAVAIDDQRVYRTDLDGYWATGDYHILAYDLATGDLVWDQVIVGNGGVSAPAVADGKVYVNRVGHSGISGGSDEDRPWLYVLDARTGAVLQRQTYSAQWASDEQPVIQGGQIVAPNGYYGGLGAWSTSSLTPRWNSAGPQVSYVNAALDGLYVYAYDDRVYSRSTGAYLGPIPPPAGMAGVSSPIVSDSGLLLFNVQGVGDLATKSGISSYDPRTRTPRWTVLLPSSPTARAVGGGVVAVTAGAQLFLFDEATGAQLGVWNAPETLKSQIVLTRNYAFVQSSRYSSSPSQVYAINLATGQSDWTYENRVEGYLLGTSMEMAFGGGRLVLSNDAFVAAFAVGTITKDGIFEVQPDDGASNPSPPPPVFIDLGRDGLWRLWDGRPTQISKADPQAIAPASDGSVFLDFGTLGLWRWTPTDGMYQVAASDPQGMAVGKDGTLLVDLGSSGLWKSTGGAALTKLNAADPQNVVGAADGSFFVDFGQFGLWRWTPSGGLRQLNAADPESMAAGADGSLFVDFGRFGLWRWTAAGGIKLLNAADPESMAAGADGSLFVDFGRFGLWRWIEGSGMLRLLESDPDGLVVAAGQLYVDFGSFGLWKWAAGYGFSKIDSGNPAQLLANADGTLYADYGDLGLWTWKSDKGLQRLTKKRPQGLSVYPLI